MGERECGDAAGSGRMYGTTTRLGDSGFTASRAADDSHVTDVYGPRLGTIHDSEGQSATNVDRACDRTCYSAWRNELPSGLPARTRCVLPRERLGTGCSCRS